MYVQTGTHLVLRTAMNYNARGNKSHYDPQSELTFKLSCWKFFDLRWQLWVIHGVKGYV